MRKYLFRRTLTYNQIIVAVLVGFTSSLYIYRPLIIERSQEKQKKLLKGIFCIFFENLIFHLCFRSSNSFHDLSQYIKFLTMDTKALFLLLEFYLNNISPIKSKINLINY